MLNMYNDFKYIERLYITKSVIKFVKTQPVIKEGSVFSFSESQSQI